MAFLTIVRQVDVGKIMRQAAVMLRVLICFDIFFLVSSCVQLVWMTPAVITKEDGSWDLSFLANQQYLHNYSLLSLFSTTLICNRSVNFCCLQSSLDVYYDFAAWQRQLSLTARGC